MFTPQGIAGHRLHAHTAASTRPETPREPEVAAPPAAATGVSDGPQGPSAAAPGPDPLEAPAIAPDGIAQLEAIEPGPAQPDTPPAAEVHTRRRDFGKTYESTMRQLDRVASKALGVDPSTAADLHDVIEMGKPAAEHYGERAGRLLYVGIFCMAIAAWMLSLVMRRAQAQATARPRFSAPRPAAPTVPQPEMVDE